MNYMHFLFLYFGPDVYVPVLVYSLENIYYTFSNKTVVLFL